MNASDLIRETVLKIEALDAERQKVLDDAEASGLEPELIQIVVSYRKFQDDKTQAEINLPQEYLNAMKPRKKQMTEKANGVPYQEFIENNWTDETLVAEGYMVYV